jgi:hypothetical protein
MGAGIRVLLLLMPGTPDFYASPYDDKSGEDTKRGQFPPIKLHQQMWDREIVNAYFYGYFACVPDGLVPCWVGFFPSLNIGVPRLRLRLSSSTSV